MSDFDEGMVGLGIEAPLTTIASQEDFDRLPAGAKYKGPDGKPRQKYYEVKDDYDLDRVPEGAPFMGPDGQIRMTPKYDGVNFTAQTLHDMAITPKGKKQALEQSYPGRVKADHKGELFIEDEDGTLRKPGRGVAGVGGHLASRAAPDLGMVGGMLAGVPGGPGTAAMGGVGGAMGGRAFNNIILRLAGIDESAPAELGAIGTEGAYVAGGEALGRALGHIPAAVAKAKSYAGAGYNKIGEFLGVNKETLPDALRIAEYGEKAPTGKFADTRAALGLTETDTPVRPSSVFMEAPKVNLNVETFDPGFRTQNVLKQGSDKYYTDKATDLFEDMNLAIPGSFTKPTAGVSKQDAGELLKNRALADSKAADDALQGLLAERRAALEAGAKTDISQQEAIFAASKKAQDEASGLINEALKEVDKSAEGALAAIKAGSNSGTLWTMVADQMRAVREGIQQSFRRYANNAYEVAGNTQADTSGLGRLAQSFLDTVPKDVQSQMPGVTRQMAQLAESETGAATFQQLHQLRTLLRENADYFDLPSDIKNGQFKLFASEVDKILQSDAFGENWTTAARMLNATDDWYRSQRAIFDRAEINNVIRGLKGGEGADPEKLFTAVVRPNNTDAIHRIHEVVGDTLWSGVKAAQKQNWLQKSGTADPNAPDASKFAREVVQSYHDGTLMAVQGKEHGEQLYKLAQMIDGLNGKIDISNLHPGDTAFDIMRRAYQAGIQKAEAGAADPLATLSRETRKLELAARREGRAAESADHLNFLTNKDTGAAAAVDKILRNEDLIIAVEQRYGRASPEFKALQQVWAEELFTGTTNPGKKLSNVSPEIQEIMFGTNLATAQQLAKDMALMHGENNLGKRTAQGMSLVSKIENPTGTMLSSKSGIGAATKAVIPGAIRDPIARSVLTEYYALMQKLSTSPGLLRKLEKAMAGGIQDKNEARMIVDGILGRSTLVGGAVGHEMNDQGNQPQPETVP